MDNKVVIVTGGSSGIGRACAEVFGANGFCVVITGRNEKKLSEAVEGFLSKGIKVISVVADVSIEADNQKVVSTTLEAFGRIDVLINNAGISMRALFKDVDVDVIKKVMDINFYGAVYATKACLSEILKNKGSIIGVSSIAGYRGLPGRTGYSASKFALQGFLESIRTEFLYSGVHVLTACPGFTNSNIRNTALSSNGGTQKESPLEEGKIMSAEEVGEAIYKATIKRKRGVVLTTQGKLTVFLNKWFPAFMDRMVYNHFANEKDSPLPKV